LLIPGRMITDPTAIPETEDEAKEYEQELQSVGGDWAKVEPLARALSQSDVATRQARGMAYSGARRYVRQIATHNARDTDCPQR